VDSTNEGTASYLLTSNPHLARALRARGRRWLRRWTTADGLVDPDDLALAALASHQISARSFSPTGLQHFAVCPYRFFLQAIHRLQPREEPVAIETLDPLTRGALFHDAQFKILTRLRDLGLLPVGPATVERAIEIVDDVVKAESSEYAEKLAPAIPRVWDDAIAAIRADLREWLRRASEKPDGWAPYRFELAFGLALPDRPNADPASVPQSIPIAGGLQLRGSIDLVEKDASGVLRATDHKTGKVRATRDVVIGGGKVLQPVLYALACETLLEAPVESGRLYYCTADGGYTERLVLLNDGSRKSAEEFIGIVKGALETGFFPAYPEKGACDWCDYRLACGPYEERRTSRKPKERMAELERLRSMP
jgi:hypothetical protein